MALRGGKPIILPAQRNPRGFVALPVTHVCWTDITSLDEEGTQLAKGLVTLRSTRLRASGGGKDMMANQGVIDIAAPFTPIYDASRFPCLTFVCFLKKSNAVIGLKR